MKSNKRDFQTLLGISQHLTDTQLDEISKLKLIRKLIYEWTLSLKSNYKFLLSEWRCEVCKKMRLDKDISVIKHDMSDGKGEIIYNIKYCNDNLHCLSEAQIINKWKHY